MKIIYLEATINYMFNVYGGEYVNEIANKGTTKETEGGLRYILITE